MHASAGVLTVYDWHNVFCDADFVALVKLWLRCSGRGLSMQRCISSRGDYTHVRRYKQVGDEMVPWAGLQSYGGSPLAKMGPSCFTTHRPFCHLYFAKRFTYWAHHCELEHFRGHAIWISVGCQILNYLLSCVSLPKLLCQNTEQGVKAGGVAFTLCVNAPGFCVLFRVIFNPFSSSGSVLAH